MKERFVTYYVLFIYKHIKQLTSNWNYEAKVS